MDCRRCATLSHPRPHPTIRRMAATAEHQRCFLGADHGVEKRAVDSRAGRELEASGDAGMRCAHRLCQIASIGDRKENLWDQRRGHGP
jgi:hypothetical protein